MTTRSYRLNLAVDIYIEKEAEETWQDVEEELEDRYAWEIFHDRETGYVQSANLDSYVEED